MTTPLLRVRAESMLRAVRQIDWNRPYMQKGRIERLAAVLHEHPDAQLEVCGAEKTGHRYGAAACRRGRSSRIGSTTDRFVGLSGYQIWAVWAGNGGA
jgi:hypothetical protein